MFGVFLWPAVYGPMCCSGIGGTGSQPACFFEVLEYYRFLPSLYPRYHSARSNIWSPECVLVTAVGGRGRPSGPRPFWSLWYWCSAHFGAVQSRCFMQTGRSRRLTGLSRPCACSISRSVLVERAYPGREFESFCPGRNSAEGVRREALESSRPSFTGCRCCCPLLLNILRLPMPRLACGLSMPTADLPRVRAGSDGCGSRSPHRCRWSSSRRAGEFRLLLT